MSPSISTDPVQGVIHLPAASSPWAQIIAIQGKLRSGAFVAATGHVTFAQIACDPRMRPKLALPGFAVFEMSVAPVDTSMPIWWDFRIAWTGARR